MIERYVYFFVTKEPLSAEMVGQEQFAPYLGEDSTAEQVWPVQFVDSKADVSTTIYVIVKGQMVHNYDSGLMQNEDGKMSDFAKAMTRLILPLAGVPVPARLAV